MDMGKSGQGAGTIESLSAYRILRTSIVNALPVYVILCLIDAVVVACCGFLQPIMQSGSGVPVGSPYFANQILLHVVSGYIVGGVSLDLSKALIGAGLGPLIDIDHLGAIAGLPVAARAGHSFVVMAVLVGVVWGLSLWRWGGPDFALFASLEFFTHLMVAPPGFPLLSPIAPTTFYPPYYVWMLPTLALGAAYFLKCRRGRQRASSSVRGGGSEPNP
jgi:hypothetical protein